MAGSVAVDIQNISRIIDSFDATDATDRNLQSAFYLARQATLVCGDIKSAAYQRPIGVPVANDAAYRTAIDDALAAFTTANANLLAILTTLRT
jgi:hypothetical protein